MRIRLTLMATLAVATLLPACASLREPPLPPPSSYPGSSTVPGRAPPPANGTEQPQPSVPTQPVVPEQPQRPPPKQFRLGPAATALVTQARTQASGGNYAPAAATLERALRIEPDNPLLWIELGRVRMSEGNAAQADGLARKALALATGDYQAQGSAWRLIAESLRARDRNQEAADAERRAQSLAPR